MWLSLNPHLQNNSKHIFHQSEFTFVVLIFFSFFFNIAATRQMSSMIHLARPTVTPVATIIFCCFVLLDLKSERGRTTCGKIMITTGRDFGLAEWIKNISFSKSKNPFSSFSHKSNYVSYFSFSHIFSTTSIEWVCTLRKNLPHLIFFAKITYNILSFNILFL